MAELFYGSVKFYDSAKRFGFIGRDHPGAPDVFVGDCGRGLHAGDEVSFHITTENDGRQRASWSLACERLSSIVNRETQFISRPRQ